MSSSLPTRAERAPRAPEPVAAPRTPPVAYDYASLDDRPVSDAGMKGRATVLAFITTFGDSSALEVRYVEKVLGEHVPRINAAAVFLEPIENRPLARLFRTFHKLSYPLAMGDTDTIVGRGPFAGISAVPTVVVLDAEGREVFRKVGVTQPDEIDRALRDAERPVWGNGR